MIDIEKLRSFYYVIKEGSLLKAAAVLEKNHTTLSKHLTDLEETYNVKLFTRKRKRIELTEKGEELFKVAQNTIPNLENGAAEILAPKAQPLRLRILTTTGVIGVWLIRKVKLLCEEFPDLRVAIITTNMDIDFEASKADVGILHKQNVPGLSQKKLRTIHLSLYASKDYIEKNGKPKTIDELSNYQIISFYSDYEGNLGNIDWHLKRNLPDHSLRESYLSVNSGILLFEAGCQGLGIIPMMDEFEYLEDSNLEKILPEEKGPAIDLYYVFRSDVVLTKVQKRFFEILSS
ncbi:LysR family transcriptional regulator [Kamptonema cortianum]|jgi:DNA-binding transcriptional LysR family regulator|nr:LysR family transcriptional regulator [Geitlerinema splendidum]MDK3155612.1 LysR family transcriptional regulator [Kamptonema cortianum]